MEWSCLVHRSANQEAFVSHANATLTPITRLRLARLVVDAGWTYVAAAARCSWSLRGPRRSGPTGTAAEGPAGMVTGARVRTEAHQDPPGPGASDRAVAMASPAWPGPDRRPARDAGLDGARGACAVPDQPALQHRPSHRRAVAPLRARPPRLADPRRRDQVRQHPDRWWPPVRGTTAGRTEQAGDTRPAQGQGLQASDRESAFVHTVIDDHSRVAYAEICADEKAVTAVGVLAARYCVVR